jgi:hypothetical protein
MTRLVLVLLLLATPVFACNGRPPKPPRNCPDVVCHCDTHDGDVIQVLPCEAPCPACVLTCPQPPPPPICRHCKAMPDRHGVKHRWCRSCDFAP